MNKNIFQSKNKKYLFSVSLLISLLITLIPVALATEIDAYDKVDLAAEIDTDNGLVLKTSEQRVNLYQNGLSDPGESCIAQNKQTSAFADALDNEVISTLEKIASVLFAICTTMSAIDTIISATAMVIGMWSGPCCRPEMMVCPGPCGAPCTAMEAKFRTWSVIYTPVKAICCFVNCGWCTGADGCFGFFGIDLKSVSLGAVPDVGIAGPGGGISQFGLSPYDNIYLAVGCLCPIAIIFNMRKLKTIYDVYNCCVEQACENGLNTEACEQQLEEATCIYWEGSLYSMMAKVLMSMITNAITGVLASLIAANILACVYAVFKIVQVPKVIMGVISAWEYMGRTFEEPACEDLGFDAIKTDSQKAFDDAADSGFEDVNEETMENWERITLVDQNDDGVYDYHAPVWTAVAGKEKTYTSTVWSRDAKGELGSKTYQKIDGKITNNEGKKVGFLEWEGIKGNAVPNTDVLSMSNQGTGIIAGKSYDRFDVVGQKVEFYQENKVVQNLDLTKTGDAQVFVNSLGINEHKLGGVTKGIETDGTINLEKGKVQVLQTATGTDPTVLQISSEGKTPLTEIRYSNGIVSTQSYSDDAGTKVSTWELTQNQKVLLSGKGAAPSKWGTFNKARQQAKSAGIIVDGATETRIDGNILSFVKEDQKYYVDTSTNQITNMQTIGDITIAKQIGITKPGSQFKYNQYYSVITNEVDGLSYYLKDGDPIPKGYVDMKVKAISGDEIIVQGATKKNAAVDIRTIPVYGVTPPITDIDRATLIIEGKNYDDIPLSLINEVGGVIEIKSVQNVDEYKTTITLKDGSTVDITQNGDNVEIFNTEGDPTATWNVQGTKVTKTIGENQRIVESSFQDAEGNRIRVKEHLSIAKGSTDFSPSQDVEMTINGKTITIPPESFRELELKTEEDNQQKIDNIVTAYNMLDKPDKLNYDRTLGYSTGGKLPDETLKISTDGQTTTLTKYDKNVKDMTSETIKIETQTDGTQTETKTKFKKRERGKVIQDVLSKEIITRNSEGRITFIRGTGEDTHYYSFDIDPKTGKIEGDFLYGDLYIDDKFSPQGTSNIYDAGPTIKGYNFGLDQNGEMWMKEVDEKSWTKASDDKFKQFRTENKDKFDSIKKQGKAAMELKEQKEEQAKEKIEKQKTSTKEKLAQKEADYESAYNMMYEVVWTLLDLTLSEPINELIADQCKSDSDKSYPPVDTTTDSGGGISSGVGGSGGPCQGIDYNIYNAQFVSKTPLANGNCDYRVTYGISACGNAITYDALISGTPDSETLESDSVSLGQTISRSNILESQICTHQSICLTTNDGHNQCYPPLP
jgi:hypothetical protein